MTEQQLAELRVLAAKTRGKDGFASERELKLADGVTRLLSERGKLVEAVRAALLHVNGPQPLTNQEIAEFFNDTLDDVWPERRGDTPRG